MYSMLATPGFQSITVGSNASIWCRKPCTTSFTPANYHEFRNNNSMLVSKQVKSVVKSAGKHFVKCNASSVGTVDFNNEVNKNEAASLLRPLADFPADIWADSFSTFSLDDTLMRERYAIEIEPLKEEVRKLVSDDSMELSKKITLIDTLERLGVYYYYETEIEDSIRKIYEELATNNFVDHTYDLYDTATHFRVLRQHGYKIPCDVFNKFTDGEGRFKEGLSSDIRGVLSLYEAAHVRIRGDNILDEAITFTTNILKSSSTTNASSQYSKQVIHALRQALHFGNPSDERIQFISFYEEDECRHETLLRLAKMEFNRLQLLHRQELSQIQQWWQGLDLGKKLPYARQRSVECFWCVMMIYYEPQYSLARLLLAKVFLLLSILDDTYDAYGTFDELQHLTQAFERWDVNEMEQFPEDYMKVVFGFVLDIFYEFAMEMSKRGKPYAAEHTKARVVDLVKCYYNEATWLKTRRMPTFDEYFANARITSAVQLIITAALMGMEEVTEEKPYQLITQCPTSIDACEIIGRLGDDITGHEEELARGDHPSSVECYMVNYKRSKEEAVGILRNMMKTAWKTTNEELLRNDDDENHDFSRPILKRILNLCRMGDVIYKDIDAYTYSPHVLKNIVISTFIKPFPI